MSKFTNTGRDYTTRPTQSNGRDHFNYGRTQLSSEENHSGFSWLWCLAFVLIASYFAWQFFGR